MFVFSDIPGGSEVKASACNTGDKWQPTPVLLAGKFHGQRSLVGYSPWGHKESDTTEQLHSLHFKESADTSASHTTWKPLNTHQGLPAHCSPVWGTPPPRAPGDPASGQHRLTLCRELNSSPETLGELPTEELISGPSGLWTMRGNSSPHIFRRALQTD